jgi:hypothetical protein
MILAYAKTAQGGWRFWPFQWKSRFDPSDPVKSAEKKIKKTGTRPGLIDPTLRVPGPYSSNCRAGKNSSKHVMPSLLLTQ